MIHIYSLPLMFSKTFTCSVIVITPTHKNYNPIFKQFTQKLSSKGKPTKVIIVAIMCKLLHIVFGVIKNNSIFNPILILDS
ncbi:MAG: hypothetical protein PV347_06170 [Rickettsiaceae bacterium]|nr:hypothetical protein [Rickettsiaceae bacterium]MDD9336850.1 hypothetical protein [Rickettsiaceae bacterium]